MSETFLEFENTVEDEAGASFIARVHGEERDDGKWIGWISFTPADGGQPYLTARETTQPERDDLEYWATGLTYFYLEGALHRAKGERERREPRAEPAAPPPAGRGVPRMEVETLSERVVEQLIGRREPRPGDRRDVPDAGTLVYEGVANGSDGASSVHVFAVQYGSKNAAAVLSNWLWSRLHGAGATVRIGGAEVQLTNDAIRDALLASRS